MADGVFNISKGSFVEKVRDDDTQVFFLLLQANEAEATLVDRRTVALMLAEGGTTEADFASYARKTGLTGVITIDDTNNLVDVDMDDQTFLAATSGQSIAKAIVCYEEGADDIPMTHHDAAVTTDGTDITFQINSAGFGRAA